MIFLADSMFKKYLKKIIVISAVCAIVDMLAHTLWAPLHDYSPSSYFVVHNLFKPAAAIVLLISCALLAVVLRDLIKI